MGKVIKKQCPYCNGEGGFIGTHGEFVQCSECNGKGYHLFCCPDSYSPCYDEEVVGECYHIDD